MELSLRTYNNISNALKTGYSRYLNIPYGNRNSKILDAGVRQI
jgi:flagellar hook-associated protein FlgK